MTCICLASEGKIIAPSAEEHLTSLIRHVKESCHLRVNIDFLDSKCKDLIRTKKRGKEKEEYTVRSVCEETEFP